MAKLVRRRAVLALVVGATAMATVSVQTLGAAATNPGRCRAQAAVGSGRWLGVIACRTQSPAARAEQDLLTRVNAERLARGIAPLRWDASLASEARAWSTNMSRWGFRHSNLSRLFSGRFDEVAENIAWASGPGITAGVLHLNWMHSSGHRENMMATGLDVIGIGVYCAPDGSMWATQNFGRFTATGPPVALPPVAANPIVRPDRGTISC